MTAPAIVTDVEVHFDQGEPLFFTLDALRGDEMATDETHRRYQLRVSETVTDVYLIDWRKVRYARFTARPAEPQEEPVALGGGVSVTGRTPAVGVRPLLQRSQ